MPLLKKFGGKSIGVNNIKIAPSLQTFRQISLKEALF
jgi:hypothetical protein